MARNISRAALLIIACTLAVASLSLDPRIGDAIAETNITGDVVRRVAGLRMPRKPFKSFDGGVVVGGSGIYAQADRSNADVDLFNTQDGHFSGRVTGISER